MRQTADTANVAQAKQAGAKTQNVAVYKKRPDGTAPYKVVDNVNFMTESDWLVFTPTAECSFFVCSSPH